MSPATIVIGAVVAGLLVLALIHTLRHRGCTSCPQAKKGVSETTCGGCCSACSSHNLHQGSGNQPPAGGETTHAA